MSSQEPGYRYATFLLLAGCVIATAEYASAQVFDSESSYELPSILSELPGESHPAGEICLSPKHSPELIYQSEVEFDFTEHPPYSMDARHEPTSRDVHSDLWHREFGRSEIRQHGAYEPFPEATSIRSRTVSAFDNEVWNAQVLAEPGSDVSLSMELPPPLERMRGLNIATHITTDGSWAPPSRLNSIPGPFSIQESVRLATEVPEEFRYRFWRTMIRSSAQALKLYGTVGETMGIHRANPVKYRLVELLAQPSVTVDTVANLLSDWTIMGDLAKLHLGRHPLTGEEESRVFAGAFVVAELFPVIGGAAKRGFALGLVGSKGRWWLPVRVPPATGPNVARLESGLGRGRADDVVHVDPNSAAGRLHVAKARLSKLGWNASEIDALINGSPTPHVVIGRTSHYLDGATGIRPVINSGNNLEKPIGFMFWQPRTGRYVVVNHTGQITHLSTNNLPEQGLYFSTLRPRLRLDGDVLYLPPGSGPLGPEKVPFALWEELSRKVIGPSPFEIARAGGRWATFVSRFSDDSMPEVQKTIWFMAEQIKRNKARMIEVGKFPARVGTAEEGLRDLSLRGLLEENARLNEQIDVLQGLLRNRGGSAGKLGVAWRDHKLLELEDALRIDGLEDSMVAETAVNIVKELYRAGDKLPEGTVGMLMEETSRMKLVIEAGEIILPAGRGTVDDGFKVLSKGHLRKARDYIGGLEKLLKETPNKAVSVRAFLHGEVRALRIQVEAFVSTRGY